MLDNSFKMPKYEKKEYPLIPTDTYQAELVEIEHVISTYKGEEKPQLKFVFRILEDGEYYGRFQWMYGSLAFRAGSKPTNLYKIISGITGLQYDEKQIESVDKWMDTKFLNGLVGVQVRLLVGPAERQDKTMTNKVQNILPAKENKPAFDETKMNNPF